MWVDRSQISFDVTLSYEHFPFDQQVLDFWGWQECGEIPMNEITKTQLFAQRIARSLSHENNLGIVSVEILRFFCGTPLDNLMINW